MGYTYNFDIYTGTLIEDSKINPTDINQNVIYWLHARNNKYPIQSIQSEKIGKWMIFLAPDQVNETWKKIKQAVRSGELWHSKVSTADPVKPKSHAIMIYTKDYSDVQDVVHVLHYLETSGIKPSQTTIRYKTDEQTRSGIYSGGKQKPWIYASDTIRTLLDSNCSVKSVNTDL